MSWSCDIRPRTILKIRPKRNYLELGVVVLEVRDERLAYLVPGPETAVRHRLHERVHNKPTDKDNDKADNHIEENAFRLGVLLTFPTSGECLESRPREKYRRQEYCDVDTCVQ